VNESALERPHLAIVTQDLSLSHFLTEGLLYEGFWTSSIGSGLQFLEVLRLRTFDAVILDAELGDIAVTEMLRRMRGTSDRVLDGSPRSGMPVMVITGIPGEIERTEVLEAGGQGLLEPPLEIADVAAAMRALLGRV
jgi:DNA-binding response OmpR family regulator